MAIVDAGANQTPALEILYRHIFITMIICRQGKVFWIKVSKVQERRDADVGEIENSGEEQECRKKTKKERRTKMKLSMKTVAMTLIVTIIVLVVGNSMAFASVDTKEGLSVIPLTDGKYMLLDENDVAIMTLQSQKHLFTVSVDTVAGKHEFFSVDTNTGTLYSSVTNRVFQREELLSDDDDESQMSTFAVEDSWIKKISYTKLAEVTGAIADKLTIAAAIISITAAIMGVTISTGPAIVVSVIGAAFVIIIDALKAPKKTKGVKVAVDKIKTVKHQAGQTFTFYQYEIPSVDTY